ncbi:hypothetical protein [Deinococcus sp. 12RED42]|uniref:hypothetical protein n=1 Tax=Deinococcus sp. 12RED42 TaxID=2745872 RepID=UPI001E63C0D5|nr:hypothetical protein [Deinococcus sp. 12RED42]MCD0164410.1 hypothetical protein [Deinococcus sp. 12RED42]
MKTVKLFPLIISVCLASCSSGPESDGTPVGDLMANFPEVKWTYAASECDRLKIWLGQENYDRSKVRAYITETGIIKLSEKIDSLIDDYDIQHSWGGWMSNFDGTVYFSSYKVAGVGGEFKFAMAKYGKETQLCIADITAP